MISKEVLYNPFLLYLLSAVTCFQLVVLTTQNQYWFCILFIITCLVTSVFSKNFIVIFCIGLVILHIFMNTFKIEKQATFEGFIFKRIKKKFTKARKALFGRTRAEKKRDKRKKKRRFQMDREKLDSMNDKINNLDAEYNIASALPISNVQVHKNKNNTVGRLSETYIEPLINNNYDDIKSKTNFLVTKLNETFNDMNNNIISEFNTDTNLRNYNCDVFGTPCKYYFRNSAIKSIKTPMENLYNSLLNDSTPPNNTSDYNLPETVTNNDNGISNGEITN